MCDQSPIIIQYSTPTPFRLDPIDGTGVFHFDLYNNVLGYGKAVETVTIRPDEDTPGKYRLETTVLSGFLHRILLKILSMGANVCALLTQEINIDRGINRSIKEWTDLSIDIPTDQSINQNIIINPRRACTARVTVVGSIQ